MADKLQTNVNNPSDQEANTHADKKKTKKYHLGIEQALEEEIGLEIERGQLTENELNSGNDI